MADHASTSTEQLIQGILQGRVPRQVRLFAAQGLLPVSREEILRIDRDSTRRKGELEEKLESVRQGDVDILVGTQMMAKGHDFPSITLVGILNADQGIYGSDFRAPETMLQRVIQVSGRAGRADLDQLQRRPNECSIGKDHHETGDQVVGEEDHQRGDPLRRGWFVRHDQARIQGQRPRDADPLPLPARELVRVAVEKVRVQA